MIGKKISDIAGSIILFVLMNKCNIVKAQAVFKFGGTNFDGTGCPPDTISLISSSDGSSISVLFSAYTAETTSDVKRDRLSCNLAVTLDVQEGASVGIYRVDYRGFADVPNVTGKEVAKFRAEYFFAGYKGPVVEETFTSGYSNDFFIRSDVTAQTVVYSPCGASTIFRINTSLSAQKDNYEDEGDVFTSIDTIDISQPYGFHYYLTDPQAC